MHLQIKPLVESTLTRSRICNSWRLFAAATFYTSESPILKDPTRNAHKDKLGREQKNGRRSESSIYPSSPDHFKPEPQTTNHYHHRGPPTRVITGLCFLPDTLANGHTHAHSGTCHFRHFNTPAGRTPLPGCACSPLARPSTHRRSLSNRDRPISCVCVLADKRLNPASFSHRSNFILFLRSLATDSTESSSIKQGRRFHFSCHRQFKSM